MSLNQNIDAISGGGWGGIGGGGGGLMGFILGAALTNRGGGLFGGGCNDAAAGGTLGYSAGVLAGENAKYRDVVASENSINNNVNGEFAQTNAYIDRGFDRVANVSRTGAEQTLAAIANQTQMATAGFGSLASAMKDISYQGLMQAKDIQTQIASSTCGIKQAVHADGECTRALITQTNIQCLRDKLNETERQRDLLATGNFPIGRPAALVYIDPCAKNGNGNSKA